MDNTRDLPGYKHYVDPASGERPAVMVAFLDLVPDPESAVNGVVFEVDDLAALDERERNYERREARPGVWAYFGTEAARERFERGPTVICRDYYEGVRESFDRLGELARFESSTDTPSVPIRDLRRIDHTGP
jgi:hypothetical protein